MTSGCAGVARMAASSSSHSTSTSIGSSRVLRPADVRPGGGAAPAAATGRTDGASRHVWIPLTGTIRMAQPYVTRAEG